MAVPGIKFDDGTGGFANNCFPVRTLIAQNVEGSSGAWLVAQKAEQRRRFKALICSKPRTFTEIRNQRKQAERNNTTIIPQYADEEEEPEDRVLDGFFLMKHCCVDDPADLCSINISCMGLSEVKEEDLPLFDNVAYCNASENLLSLEAMKNFPILRELELSLNGIRSPKIHPADFQYLEVLDLSYNNLSPEDVLPLGLIQSLKTLYLSGNGLYTLPADMARPYTDQERLERIGRYRSLEVLMLDDNKFSDQVIFSALAGLRRLKHLDLSKNQLKSVPQLMLIEGRHVAQDSSRKTRRSKPSSGRSRPSSRRSGRANPEQQVQPDHVAAHIHSEAAVSDGQENVNIDPGSGSIARDKPLTPIIPEECVAQDILAQPNMSEPGTLRDVQNEEQNLDKMLDGIMDSMPPSLTNSMTDGQKNHGQAFERAGESDFPLPPPYPELQHLNLSHNLISQEEDLLAVAAWPMLSELLIHNNPLTTKHSGDPPLLRKFLRERLGVKIQRKCPPDPAKPHIEVPVKPDRKVVLRILPVPRCNVDELLALEAPKPSSARSNPMSPATPKSGRPRSQLASCPPRIPTPPASMESTKPLPPIATDPAGAEAFFMTQVDEQGNERPSSVQSEVEPATRRLVGTSTQSHKSRQKSRDVDKYKGYEILLDGEDEDAVPISKDLPGNIRALQYALAHPLLFRDNPDNLQVPQPPCRPLLFAKRQPPQKPKKSRGERLNDALTYLKARSTVIETDLPSVLIDKKNTAEFTEAEQLLARLRKSMSPEPTSHYKLSSVHTEVCYAHSLRPKPPSPVSHWLKHVARRREQLRKMLNHH